MSCQIFILLSVFKDSVIRNAQFLISSGIGLNLNLTLTWEHLAIDPADLVIYVYLATETIHLSMCTQLFVKSILIPVNRSVKTKVFWYLK